MASPLPSSSSIATSPESSGPVAPNPSIQKSFSCVLCASRKVKCDKSPGGCGNCTKARVKCIYKTPPPPRRRKKGVREIDVHARLRLYEDALRKLGVEPADLEREELHKLQVRRASLVENTFFEEDAERAQHGRRNSDAGVLISGDGKSRYLENQLWTSLRGEFRDSKELLEESSEEEDFQDSSGSSPVAFSNDGSNLLFGIAKSATNLRHAHPQPVQVFKLWQTYLDNINPLVKVFHTPTVQQQILNSSGNLDEIPKNIEALLFGIYCISLGSIGDAECDAIMGEPKAIVTQRFRSAAQHALINANFLKSSDLMVLQAFVLFLLSLQNYDARVIFILTGIAGRIGQRLGLHRDGEILGLPPFEVEMRRRLWWQIMFLEGFAEKLAGTGSKIFMGDTKMPSNLNDSDLFQGMKEIPKEHEGATEMMHFLIRCHGGQFLKRAATIGTPLHNFDGAWNRLSSPSINVAAKDKAIDELEAMLHHKFLQYCDRSIPWHFMCSYLVKALICMMRFMAHNSEVSTNGTSKMAQAERDVLFNISLEVCSFQILAYTTKEMQGFLWHVNMHFQWKALIYLISELRYRTEAPLADDAWKKVQMVFDFHPNFNKEVSKRALPIAIGNLTLKAWDAYLTARGMPEGGEPYFIQVLRSQRMKAKSSRTPSEQSELPPTQYPASTSLDDGMNLPPESVTQKVDPLQSFQWNPELAASLDISPVIPDLPPLDPDQMNWSAWENLLVDFSMQDATAPFSAANGFGFAGQ
ncbi:uncharacterized protein BDR25DRAFT_346753 [Lindgomyces ingoldianus]|uniref:Uncharacterized protein n=1 Tax=Lindgomyces ingoldianus TaxID=673940 RepID=A0ACB6QB97_9PLEO|nr:uncharacterized protein BDR25DRAFT_346753 [Lindgomyces ingoldianus]KAF2464233.1 hypothetical protein BDR25DRAFT_346753 [Lindgomyces ingoldianus]